MKKRRSQATSIRRLTLCIVVKDLETPTRLHKLKLHTQDASRVVSLLAEDSRFSSAMIKQFPWQCQTEKNNLGVA